MLEIADQILNSYKSTVTIRGKLYNTYSDGWAHIAVGKKNFFYDPNLRCNALILMAFVPWLEANF